jgi:hypothetical protein
MSDLASEDPFKPNPESNYGDQLWDAHSSSRSLVVGALVAWLSAVVLARVFVDWLPGTSITWLALAITLLLSNRIRNNRVIFQALVVVGISYHISCCVHIVDSITSDFEVNSLPSPTTAAPFTYPPSEVLLLAVRMSVTPKAGAVVMGSMAGLGPFTILASLVLSISCIGTLIALSLHVSPHDHRNLLGVLTWILLSFGCSLHVSYISTTFPLVRFS